MVKNIFFVGGCSDFRVFTEEMKEKKGRKTRKKEAKTKKRKERSKNNEKGKNIHFLS
jgi:hypothetical protein